MDKKYLLDTSAFFTLIGNEPGTRHVEEIIESAGKKHCEAFFSFISILEIYYILWREEGEAAARKAIVSVKSLPLQKVESNERIMLSAGRLKANYKLSVADAIIAATALDKNAILIHKDPEFIPLSHFLRMIELPFKK